MKKILNKNIITYISSIIIIALIALIIINVKSNDVRVYNFNVNDTDLSLENFTIVSSNNFYYISDSYNIHIIGENKNIQNVTFKVICNNVLISDLVFQFPNSTKIYAQNDVLGSKCKINDSTTLSIKFKYTLEGVEKEAYQSVELKKYKKSYK